MYISNLDYLQGYVPEAILDELKKYSYQYGMITPLRAAHFLGQCAHESNFFKVKRENLNYTADGLSKVWPKLFATNGLPNDLAKNLAHNPKEIANKVYALKGGNGNEASGDGWKYRGSGPLQLTLKNNYKALGNSLGIDLVTNPELVSSVYPMVSGLWYFKTNNVWEIADKGSDDSNIKEVTKLINKAALGLTDRIQWTNKFKVLLKA